MAGDMKIRVMRIFCGMMLRFCGYNAGTLGL